MTDGSRIHFFIQAKVDIGKEKVAGYLGGIDRPGSAKLEPLRGIHINDLLGTTTTQERQKQDNGINSCSE
ncbi:hypothetical protein [Aeromonas hydrophila]|uniref:hypothetical protein n=1 Tax=Aeromonas hydrophila TaxID=644 RepID=UPI003F84DD7C